MNKMAAKTNIESVSRSYMNAKRSAQEYENISRGLNRGGTSTPLRGTPQEIQQVGLCTVFQSLPVYGIGLLCFFLSFYLLCVFICGSCKFGRDSLLGRRAIQPELTTKLC